MPKVKKRPVAQQTSAANGSASEVFTLAEVADYLRLSERQVIDLVHKQNLPGRAAGNDWRFLKSAVQDWLAIGPSGRPSRKEAQLVLAGKYKDDPDLMHICEEAYRQRGQTITEGQ